LDEVVDVAVAAVAGTRSMGVGLSPTILPSAGKPTFELGEGEMEVGIGIHGEPGVHRGPVESADAVTERLTGAIVDDLKLHSGDRVAVLVNGMGATPLEELYIMYRRAWQLFRDLGVEVHRSYVGEFATSLEMAGASISVIRLEDGLTELLDAPAQSPFFLQ